MDSEDNSLTLRQLQVVRKNLVTVFRFSVKALIDKACFCSIDDGCEEFVNFSATLENILQHRIRSGKTWYLGDDKGHYWMYVKAACRRSDLRSCISNIDNIENIKSPVAKGRAFIRYALMEKHLSEYLVEAVKQTNITRRYYLPGAIMLGEDASELCGVLLGLNSVDFGFCLKGENYDTVECPLAVSYTPYMKFKQSQESMHSDLEEMRELSCGSSLASEDGNDNEPSAFNQWPDRYNALHKRYITALQQKSFLEELAASQEKALQTAAAAQQESCRLQRDAAEQKHQYEAVILELQAQVSRMKTVNESLQQQLVASRNARFLMEEIEAKGESAESSRFAAAMTYKQDIDRLSFTSAHERRTVASDTRSVASAISETSVDMAGARLSEARMAARGGEDTQSMMPLTGSLADLQLDLEPGLSNNALRASDSDVAVVLESFSAITNPEQMTPVVSVSLSAYTIAFLDSGEFTGNGEEDNIHIRGNNHFQQNDPTTDVEQLRQSTDETVNTTLQQTYTSTGGTQAEAGGESSPEIHRKVSDDVSDDSKMSEPEILARETSTSDKDNSSETEVLSQDHEEEETGQRDADSSPKEAVDAGEREHLTVDEDASDPEVLTREDEESSSDGEPSPAAADKESDGGATDTGDTAPRSGHEEETTTAVSDLNTVENSFVSGGGGVEKTVIGDKAGDNAGKSQEDRDKGGSGSDSGSSEVSKAAWDMLSDVDHDSN